MQVVHTWWGWCAGATNVHVGILNSTIDNAYVCWLLCMIIASELGVKHITIDVIKNLCHYQGISYSGKAKFAEGKFDKFDESSMIQQTKTMQIITYKLIIFQLIYIHMRVKIMRLFCQMLEKDNFAKRFPYHQTVLLYNT